MWNQFSLMKRPNDVIVNKTSAGFRNFGYFWPISFFEFVFMLVVRSTGSICTPELVDRISIETGSGRNPLFFTVSGSVVGESLVGKFRGSGNMDLKW